jgi:hypothetical protein
LPSTVRIGREQAEAEVAGEAQRDRAAHRRGEAEFEQAAEGVGLRLTRYKVKT